MKKIYINANCQGPALKQMLSEVLLDWQIESLPVHEQHSPEALQYATKYIAEADVIVSQPIANNYPTCEFRSESIKNLAKNTAQFEWFPSIYFTGQLLTLCTLKEGGRRLNTPGWLYHDCMVAASVANGEDIEAVVGKMRSIDLFTKEFVESEVKKVLHANRSREKALGCTVVLADFFEENIASQALCHSFNHPSRSVLRHVCNQILSAIGSSQRVSPEGPDYLRYPHYPLLPAVAHHLGEIFTLENFEFHWASKSLGFDDFIRSMFRSYRDLDAGTIMAALSETPGIFSMIGQNK